MLDYNCSFEVQDNDDEDSEPEVKPDISEVDSPGATASEVPVPQVINDTRGPSHDRYVCIST